MAVVFTRAIMLGSILNQGSILYPSLFTISIIDHFLKEHNRPDFSYYADAINPYNCGK